ncbi:hypothetical protein HI914_04310 [Erysiphe necator]|uniref:Elongator complex protein 6 n=1 Tax=Uncinula necator TaxID=52586 RepID=A0A0B1P4X2_UNCNE|nr:hypothetical protein HI914_04310 [Erysiphe necator]KHJ31719.1 hypothetical protein EV44_g1587 [Erysiphe necator]
MQFQGQIKTYPLSSATMTQSELESYLELPSQSSLTLITSVLGATSNWLALHLLRRTLKSDETIEPAAVLLVSFLRDEYFWEDAGQRLGLNLPRFKQTKQYGFLDGLSGLFLEEKLSQNTNCDQTLQSPDLQYIAKKIRTAIKTLKEDNEKKLLLILDGIDVLLAAAKDMDPFMLEDMIIDLREEVHATVLTLSADLPLVASLQTPLERNHAAFLMSIAHQASFIMNLRLLDTGIAKDVSGVIRITCKESHGEDRYKLEDKEFLYFIGADNRVKLFERGQQ